MRISSIASLALVGCALAAPSQPQLEGPGGEAPTFTPTGIPAPSGSASPPPPPPPPPSPPGPPGVEGGEGLPTPSSGPVLTSFPGGEVPPPVPTPSVLVVAAKRQFGGIPAFGAEDGEGQATAPVPTPSAPGFPPGPEGFPSGAPPVPSGTPSGVPFQA
ncbi:hypothetical protein BDW75DRAFT_236982 [Aspergillus navahoensis]